MYRRDIILLDNNVAQWIFTKLSADQALVIKLRWAESTQNYLSICMATGNNVWLRLRIYVDAFRVAVDGNGADQLSDRVFRDLQICVGKKHVYM